MLARQRQEHILERVTAAGGVRVADVVNELGISEMTARRDITELVAQGLVERVHGGAVAPSTSSAVTSRRRTDQAVLRASAHPERTAGQEPVTDATPPTSPDTTPPTSPDTSLATSPATTSPTSPASTVLSQGRGEQAAPGASPSGGPLTTPTSSLATSPVARRQASPAAISPATPDQNTSTGTVGRPAPAAGAGAAGTLPPAAGSALAPGTGPAADGGIGAYAASLVRPGDSVALSGGSAALDVARALARTPHFPTLTVVTTSLPAAQLLFDAVDATSAVGSADPTAPMSPTASPTALTTPASPQDRPTVVLTGGQRTPSGTLAGPAAVNALAPMHVDWVFLAADGFSPETGLTASSLVEAATNQALAATGRTVVAVVDAHAWGAVALTTFCATRDIDVLVTDTQPDGWAAQALRDVGTTLVVVPASPHSPAREPSAHSPAPPGPATQTTATGPTQTGQPDSPAQTTVTGPTATGPTQTRRPTATGPTQTRRPGATGPSPAAPSNPAAPSPPPEAPLTPRPTTTNHSDNHPASHPDPAPTPGDRP